MVWSNSGPLTLFVFAQPGLILALPLGNCIHTFGFQGKHFTKNSPRVGSPFCEHHSIISILYNIHRVSNSVSVTECRRWHRVLLPMVVSCNIHNSARVQEECHFSKLVGDHWIPVPWWSPTPKLRSYPIQLTCTSRETLGAWHNIATITTTVWIDKVLAHSVATLLEHPESEWVIDRLLCSRSTLIMESHNVIMMSSAKLQIYTWLDSEYIVEKSVTVVVQSCSTRLMGVPCNNQHSILSALQLEWTFLVDSSQLQKSLVWSTAIGNALIGFCRGHDNIIRVRDIIRLCNGIGCVGGYKI